MLLQCLRKRLQKRMDPVFAWASKRAAVYKCAWPVRTFTPEKDAVTLCGNCVWQEQTGTLSNMTENPKTVINCDKYKWPDVGSLYSLNDN